MNHLDEGTIHAWLDGALDATQSAEIEAHAKSCAECSAKVAEARGLIAASSRILVSLDEVPGNVIPKKAPVVARRRWRVAPWMTAAAAALVVITLWKKGGVERPTAAEDIAIPKVEVTSSVPEPSLERLKEPAPPPSAPTAKAPALADERKSRTANQARTQDGRGAGAGAAGGLATGAAADLASASAAPVAGDRALRREASEEARRALRPAPASPVAESALADFDAPTRLSGCYLLPGQEKKEKGALTTAIGAAGAVVKTNARTRAAAAPTATAPSAQVARSDAAAPATVVRLDTIAAVPRGFLLRDARSEGQRGTWEPINKDSVRVIMPAVGTFTFAVHEKIACPGR